MQSAKKKKKHPPTNHKIEIVGIKHTPKFFKELDEPNKLNYKAGQLGLLVGLKYKWDLNLNHFTVMTGFKFEYPNEGNPLEVFEISIDITFYISDLNKLLTVLDDDGSKFKMPPDLMNNLFTESVATARGIIYILNFNNYLKDDLIPLFDMNQISNKVNT